jgi:uncharacterized membrane protein
MARLSYYCKSCGKKNYINSKANNRFELQQELGDELKRNCSICGTYKVTHINRLCAEISSWVIIVTVIACLVLSSLLFFVGWISTLTFTVPIWFYFDQQKRANRFNKIMVSRK